MSNQPKFIIPWHGVFYAPIQMKWGTLQSSFIRISAKAAWEDFCHKTGMTKIKAQSRGYCVKRLRIDIK